jgi:hypothetical protein
MSRGHTWLYWIIRWRIVLAVVAVGVAIIMANPPQADGAVEPYREFASPEAFAEWGQAQPLLGEWNLTFINGGTTASYHIVADCDKQAEFLQRRALAQGYLVSQQIVNKNGYIANTYVANTRGQYHVGLITAIGNDWYYMDSVTHELVKIQLVRD